MLGKNNDLYSSGTSAEDQMRINAIRYESTEVYERNLYKEAARRVVFSNCMTACELDNKKVPNFNKDFYYHNQSAQNCLQDCYNTRMKLHFGSAAEKEGMLIDFKELKREFEGYQRWNPQYRMLKEFAQVHSKDYIDTVSQQLLEKTNKERYGKFEFN